jgi:hypothetical protein
MPSESAALSFCHPDRSEAERRDLLYASPPNNSRVPHISLVFREMWDSANSPLDSLLLSNLNPNNRPQLCHPVAEGSAVRPNPRQRAPNATSSVAVYQTALLTMGQSAKDK